MALRRLFGEVCIRVTARWPIHWSWRKPWTPAKSTYTTFNWQLVPRSHGNGNLCATPAILLRSTIAIACAQGRTRLFATAVSFYYLHCLLAYIFVRFLARTILPTVRVQRCTQPESGHVRFPDFSAGPTTWSSACCLSRSLAISLSPLLRLPSTLQLPTAGWRLMARPCRLPTVACFVVA